MCTVGLDGRLHVDDLGSVRFVLELNSLHLLKQVQVLSLLLVKLAFKIRNVCSLGLDVHFKASMHLHHLVVNGSRLSELLLKASNFDRELVSSGFDDEVALLLFSLDNLL